MRRRPRVEMASAPWFRAHRSEASAVAAVLFLAIFVLRSAIASERDVITVLYLLPIALLAMAGGVRAGMAASAVGVILTVIAVAVSNPSPTPLAWVTRISPPVLFGFLLGRAADDLDAAAAAGRELVAARVREREAAEINDSIIQRLAVAKWQLERGDEDRALAMLTETMETTQRLVSELLAGRPITGGPVRVREPSQPNRRLSA